MSDIRGFLAAKLQCWHRLTEAESDELVALFATKADIKMLTDDEAFDVECNNYANTAKAIQQAFCAKNNINLRAKK
jgi:hypothetical protein